MVFPLSCFLGVYLSNGAEAGREQSWDDLEVRVVTICCCAMGDTGLFCNLDFLYHIFCLVSHKTKECVTAFPTYVGIRMDLINDFCHA